MKRLQEFMKNRMMKSYSFFIIFTVAVLCIIYFIIKNFDLIAVTTGSALLSILDALTPLFIGLLLAYIINPLVNGIDIRFMSRVFKDPPPLSGNEKPSAKKKYKRKKYRSRLASIIITYVIIIILISLLIYLLASLLVGKLLLGSLPAAAGDIANNVALYEENIRNWVSDLPGGAISERINDAADAILSWISKNLSAGAIVSAVTGLFGSIVDFVIGLIISIYLLIDKDFFKHLWNGFLDLVLPQQACSAINGTLTEINDVLSRFIRGVLIDTVIVATLSSIGLTIAGLEFAVFIGIFAGICNIIPYFGPILGMVPAFLVGFITENVWQGVIAVIILLVIQQIDGNLIYPRVVGSSTGLHPLFVLLAVSIGGYYAGIAGMVLAVPVAGVLQIFCYRWIAFQKKRKEERRQEVKDGGEQEKETDIKKESKKAIKEDMKKKDS